MKAKKFEHKNKWFSSFKKSNKQFQLVIISLARHLRNSKNGFGYLSMISQENVGTAMSTTSSSHSQSHSITLITLNHTLVHLTLNCSTNP